MINCIHIINSLIIEDLFQFDRGDFNGDAAGVIPGDTHERLVQYKLLGIMRVVFSLHWYPHFC